jgi:hypothetical protein
LNAVALHAAWDFIIISGLLVANNNAPPIIFSMKF